MPIYKLTETTVMTYYIESETEDDAIDIVHEAEPSLQSYLLKDRTTFPLCLKHLRVEEAGGLEVERVTQRALQHILKQEDKHASA